MYSEIIPASGKIGAMQGDDKKAVDNSQPLVIVALNMTMVSLLLSDAAMNPNRNLFRRLSNLLTMWWLTLRKRSF